MKNHSYIHASEHAHSRITPAIVTQAKQMRAINGWVLLRGFNTNLDNFSQLLNNVCTRLTFDPARNHPTQSTQKVDAGTAAIGLHTENGNTPSPPDLVAFCSVKSAKEGSQTTLCDGIDLYQLMPDYLKRRLNQPLTVTRSLPENRWKRYVANEHPDITTPEQVTIKHLEQVLSQNPGQTAQLNDQGDLEYSLTISPIVHHRSGKKAFANAILGPSFNYEPPRYQFADGSPLSQKLKNELAELAEHVTFELQWHDNDVVLIDNTRVMHGRREILGDPQERQLFIGMGF